MSKLTKQIIESIADDRDFAEVLRDVAFGLKEKGFFNNSNWADELIRNFTNVVEIKGDNEHEISNSFVVDEPSKFNKKSNRTECPSIVNDDLFEDSNDSFEIPETQPFPPVNHSYNDELDSEGFVTMPDDGFVANDSSQSQVLLRVDGEFGQPQRSPHEPDFEDSDTIDMEMSKLEWDDSVKANDKNKSASVTPELDFNLMIKQQTAIVNTDRGCVMRDSDLEAMTSTLAKSIFSALESPQQSKVPNVPHSLARSENDKSSNCEIDESSTRDASVNVKCDEDEKIKIERIRRQDEVAENALAAKDEEAAEDAKDEEDAAVAKDEEAAADAKDEEAAEDAKDEEASEDDVHTENKDEKENVGEGRAAQNDPFKKPFVPNKPIENPHQCDDEMPETQFFFKSGDSDVGRADAVESRIDVEMAETQLFDKPNELVARKRAESNHVNDAADVDDGNVDFEETQLFSKPRATSTQDDDLYNLATQPYVSKNRPSKINDISLEEQRSKDDGSDVDVINVHVASDEIADESDEPKPKLRKRNLLIESSDEEEDTAPEIPVISSNCAEQINDEDTWNAPTQRIEHNNSAERAAFGSPTQRFEPKTRKPEPPLPKCISDLKGSDWETLCEEANNNQEKVVFKSVFDQFKDLKKVRANRVSVASASKQNAVDEAPTRQSTRSSRAKAKYGDSNDAETTSSKRRKVRIPPITPDAASDSISTNSENAPSLEVKATKNSSNVSSISSEQNDTDENAVREMQHTQVFVKATSTLKERAKPHLPRRQARASTAIQQLPEPKEIRQLTPKLRAKNNQSATYSPAPKPANVKVSSDVNENVSVAEKSEEEVKISDAVSSRSRKRKAPEPRSQSNESTANLSTRSSSPSITRSPRHVMFTMVDPAAHRETLKKLKISVAESGKYDVLITDKVYRTSKFMCALAAGKPIVSIEWLKALKEKKSTVDPFQFVLKDVVGEKRYGFKLNEALDAVQKNGGLCQNVSILVTPNTTPTPDILKDIIVSSGGKYLKTSLVARKNDRVLCISDEKDKKIVTQMKKKYPDLQEITVEQFMQGIFQYKI